MGDIQNIPLWEITEYVDINNCVPNYGPKVLKRNMLYYKTSGVLPSVTDIIAALLLHGLDNRNSNILLYYLSLYIRVSGNSG